MNSEIKYPGTLVPEIDLVGLFESPEGAIELYYGPFGGGKTYTATADAIADAESGQTVYVNWDILWSGFDERSSLRHLFFKTLFFRSRFYYFPKENLRRYYISDRWAQGLETDENGVKYSAVCDRKADGTSYINFWEWFRSRTDCKFYADEGYVLLDSYRGVKISLEDRQAVLTTRHVNRTIKIITQRPESVHVTARGNVNRFYKCEKKMRWPFLIFKRTEFQGLKNDTVDESEESQVSARVYFAQSRILDAYDNRYMRAGIPISQRVAYKAYDLSFVERFIALIGVLVPRIARGPGAVRPPSLEGGDPGP